MRKVLLTNRASEQVPDSVLPSREKREKLSKEIEKLEEEVVRLKSDNSIWGTIVRNFWPLVSGVLTIAASFVAVIISLQTQKTVKAVEDKKNFTTVLQMATDSKAGQDARIAGIWALSGYWHDPQYSPILANALSAILATEPDQRTEQSDPGLERLRQAAATVIGDAYDEKTGKDESDFLRRLLYGDAVSGSLGSVTRYQIDLASRKKKLLQDHKDPAQVELMLQATREAIRANWENLESATFTGHDLTGIELYRAKAKGAYFGDAILVGSNLCRADFSGATFDHADLSNADLYGANLQGSFRWKSANLKGANIHNVQNAPAEFTETANRTGAIDVTWPQWEERLKAMGQQSSTTFTECNDLPIK